MIRGVQKRLFCVKETKDTGICLPHAGQAVCENFSQVFTIALALRKKNLPNNGFACLWRI